MELAQGRFDDAVAALRGAADLEPTVPETQYTLGTIAWAHANRDVADAGGRMLFILEGLELENRALNVNPDYAEAMTYKSILLRMQATLTTNAAIQAELIAEANTLRNRVLALKGEQLAPAASGPASFSGFGESFEQSVARLTPIRVGGTVRVPTKTHDARPAYPAQAQADRVQGVVIIEAIVDSSGTVANARILRSIPALDEAALSAVSLWQFTPTLVNGTPVAVLMTVTVGFTLQTAR